MSSLCGENTLLRGIGRQDIHLALRWFNDPEVIQYLCFYLPLSEPFEEKWIEKNCLSENDAVFVIEALDKRNGSKPIGTCGLHSINWKDRNATFGISIGEKDFWGGGHGSEATRLLIEYAFCQLNLHRVESFVYDFNERSIKMHLKAGFKQEGRRRQACFKNNRYVDAIIFGILKEEWKM